MQSPLSLASLCSLAVKQNQSTNFMLQPNFCTSRLIERDQSIPTFDRLSRISAPRLNFYFRNPSQLSV